MLIRNVTESDFDHLEKLNTEALPHVNRVDASGFRQMAKESAIFDVVQEDDRVVAFLIAFGPAAHYESLNFQWFRERYSQFVYIDRVVVASECFRRGIGRRLYRHAEELTLEQALHLTCEVNLSPPNPGSIAFHTAMGFREVGQQDTERGTKRVSLMLKQLQR